MNNVPNIKIRVVIYHLAAAALFIALVAELITAQQVNEYLYILTLILGIGGVEMAARTAKIKRTNNEDTEDNNG